MITDSIFYLMAIPAVILQGLSKGGFAGLSLLSLPLLTLVISPLDGVVIMLPILMVQDVVTIYAYRRTFDLRAAGILIAGAIVGVAMASFFAARVSNAVIELGMGIISVGFVADAFLRKKIVADTPKQARVTPGLFWGVCAGFTSFITNNGVPPLQVYLLPLRMSSERYIGTMSVFFGVINFVKFVTFYLMGQIAAGKLLTSSVLFPLGILSTLSGVWLVRRITTARFYKIIYFLVFVIGLYLAARGIYRTME